MEQRRAPEAAPRPRVAKPLVALAVLVVAGGAVAAVLLLAPPGTLPLVGGGNDIQLLPLPSGQGFTTTLALGAPTTDGLGKWTGDFDADPPAKAFDFDGDGQMEVVAHSNDTHVYVFDSKTGRVLATLTTTYPPAWHIERILNGVEAAKLTPNGPPSIVVGNHAAFVSRWDYGGRNSDGTMKFTKAWEKHLDEFHANPGMDAKPVLADLNGDGTLDILAVTEEQGIYALKPDGSTLWKVNASGGNSEAQVGDIDGDGKPEVVVATDDGQIFAFRGVSGAWMWAFNSVTHGAPVPASIPVAPTIADLDGDGKNDIVFTTRDAHDEKDFSKDHMSVFAIHQTSPGHADVLWQFRADWANPLSYTHLIVKDLDKDGTPEVLGMDWNTIGHIPGNWDPTGPAHVFVLNADGSQRWMRELDTFWSNKDLVLMDWKGDGHLDVLANGPSDTDGFYVLDASTGQSRGFISLGQWKAERAPVVASLWGPQTTQMLVAVRPLEDRGIPEGPILVMDLGKKVDAPWPGYEPIWHAS